MKEAITGCTVWEDVNEATFVRFGQYVYTGDYDGEEPFEPPVQEPEPCASEVASVVDQELVAEENYWGALPRKSKKSKKLSAWGVEPVVEPSEDTGRAATPLARRDAWMSFTEERSYSCGVAKSVLPPKHSNTLTGYKEVFLSHAQVHIMADYYDIRPLAQLALHKLHRILCEFTLLDKRIGDIVSLLQFCFEADERPLLRELLSAYAACHFKQLWTSLEFREFFASCGELSVAVMSNLVQRLD